MSESMDIIVEGRKNISANMLERDEDIDLCLAALVSGENVLLVSDPGSGKSMLAKAIQSGIGGKTFYATLNKFTTPEELFGAVNVAKLKVGEFERIKTNMLPDATVAVLDEIFKASSAILNTTLTLLNERVWKNGAHIVDVPLKFCMGASNEWPDTANGQQELAALFDRFMIRKRISSITSEDGLYDLMTRTSFDACFPRQLTAEQLADAQAEASAAKVSREILEMIYEIIRECRREGIRVGDRRIRKSIGVIKAVAFINERDEVDRDDLEILSHVMWDDPAQSDKTASIINRIATPSGLEVNNFLAESTEIEKGVNRDDVASLAISAKKLKEISRKLGKIHTPRADRAAARVDSMIKAISMRTIASFG